MQPTVEELEQDLRKLRRELANAREAGDYEQTVVLQLDAALLKQHIEQLKAAP